MDGSWGTEEVTGLLLGAVRSYWECWEVTGGAGRVLGGHWEGIGGVLGALGGPLGVLMSPLSPPVCKVAAHKRCESKVRGGEGVTQGWGGPFGSLWVPFGVTRVSPSR